MDRALAKRLTRDALLFAGVDDGLDELISEVKKLGVGGRDTTYGVGKKMGDNTWVHRSYESVFPGAPLKKAKSQLPSDFEYAVVRYNRKDGSFAFIACDDFDTADEPTVGESVKVSKIGDVKRTAPAEDPLIWHHKWTFVSDDYDGFDVAESVQRSIHWKSHLGKDSTMSSRIGRKSVWEKEVVPKLSTARETPRQYQRRTERCPPGRKGNEKKKCIDMKETRKKRAWEKQQREKDKREAEKKQEQQRRLKLKRQKERSAASAATVVDKRALNRLVRATQKALLQLGSSILKPQYKGSTNPMTGHCYSATDALYWMLGGSKAGWKPMGITHEGASHWYLKHVPTGTIVDATDSQFCSPVPHDQGRGRGFPRPKIGGKLGPGKAAQKVIALVKQRLGEIPVVVKEQA